MTPIRWHESLVSLSAAIVALAASGCAHTGQPAVEKTQAQPVHPASPVWKYDVDILQGADFSARTPQAMDRFFCDEKGCLWARVGFTWPDGKYRNTDQYTPRAKGGIIISRDLGLTWEITDAVWPFPSDRQSTLSDGTIIETGSNVWERHPRSEIKALENKGYRVWDLGEEEGYCAIIYDMWARHSTDGGKTWATRAVHEQIGFFAAFVTRGIQRVLDDGTIVVLYYAVGTSELEGRQCRCVRFTEAELREAQ